MKGKKERARVRNNLEANLKTLIVYFHAARAVEPERTEEFVRLHLEQGRRQRNDGTMAGGGCVFRFGQEGY